jgi:hypothetical protein
MSNETDLVKAVLLRVGSIRGVRVWRNNTGALRDHAGRMVSFGLKGSADITGIIGPNGKRLEIECKTAKGKQTAEQSLFQAMIEKEGGVYLLVRSADEAIEKLEQLLEIEHGF